MDQVRPVLVVVHRERLFMERERWKREIHRLLGGGGTSWAKESRETGGTHTERIYLKNRRGFGYNVRAPKARPSNMAVPVFTGVGKARIVYAFSMGSRFFMV